MDKDTARLDFLAEITNLSALEVAGAKLAPEKLELLAVATDALSRVYEIHRRTSDTPKAFRLAVDDAMSKAVDRGDET